MINEIEDSIVKRLRAKIPAPIRVEAFPEAPEGYQFLTPHGSIYVRFQEEDFETPSRAMGIIKQDGTLTFVVSVLHRNLRVQGGIYKFLDQIKVALRGFKPIPGTSKIWITKTGLIGEEKGTWHYEIWLSLVMPQVEKEEDEAPPPLFHHGTFVGGFGQLDIVENEAEDHADETVTFTHTEGGVSYSRTEPMPPHDESNEQE